MEGGEKGGIKVSYGGENYRKFTVTQGREEERERVREEVDCVKGHPRKAAVGKFMCQVCWPAVPQEVTAGRG